MADVKISAAADAGTLVATDKVPLARSASTTAYSATMAEIASWTNTNLPVASTSVAGVVKVDGTTITISSGTISGSAAPPASSSLPYMDGTAAPGTATSWSRGDHVHPSDTAKAPLASPTFTGTPSLPTGTTGVTQTTGDNSTKLATTAFVQSQMVASGAGVSTWNTRAGAVVLQQSDITAVGALNDIGRNLIHNGQFTVAQRGAGPWATGGAYTADRWVLQTVNDTPSITIASIADSGRAAIGDEAATSMLQNIFTGNAAAGAQSYIAQNIEGVRRLAGKTVTISFWAQASSALKLGVNMSQIFGTGGSPSAGLWVLPTGNAVTLSTGWARYSTTISLPSISGKTLGTNNNDYTGLSFFYSSGATNNATAGNIGVQSGTIQLWGIQLEIGTVATPLAKREYAEELRLAQRYYQTGHVGQSIGANSWQAGWGNQHIVPLPVPMRAQPTITVSGITQTNCSATAVAAWGNFAVIHSYNITAATGGVASAADFTASADL